MCNSFSGLAHNENRTLSTVISQLFLLFGERVLAELLAYELNAKNIAIETTLSSGSGGGGCAIVFIRAFHEAQTNRHNPIQGRLAAINYIFP